MLCIDFIHGFAVIKTRQFKPKQKKRKYLFYRPFTKRKTTLGWSFFLPSKARFGCTDRGKVPRSVQITEQSRVGKLACQRGGDKKRTFVYQTKVPFLNDVCQSSLSELYGKMMTASPNDVCLAAHWANIASLRVKRATSF